MSANVDLMNSSTNTKESIEDAKILISRVCNQDLNNNMINNKPNLTYNSEMKEWLCLCDNEISIPISGVEEHLER